MDNLGSSRHAQLERIAQLLGRSAQSFSTDDEGMAMLNELLEVWHRLTHVDRSDVLVFAAGRAARGGSQCQHN